MDYTDIIKRLKDISLADGESSHTHLSAIAGAVLQPTYGWTSSECMNLRERLVSMAYNARAFDDVDTYVERLHEAVANHGDITVNGVDYMSYPLDSDGVQIHIGDELITNHSKKKLVVTRLQYSRKHAWMVGGAEKDDLSKYGLYAPCETRHYRKPTVEEVLTRMLDAVADGSVGYDEAASKYAKLLCLKEADDD